MNERTVTMVTLLSFTGEEGFMRRGRRFLASKSRAEFLSKPIKGERQALAQVLYETQVKTEPAQETKTEEVKIKKKRKKKEK